MSKTKKLAAAAFAFAFVFASCKSTPEPETPPVTEDTGTTAEIQEDTSASQNGDGNAQNSSHSAMSIEEMNKNALSQLEASRSAAIKAGADKVCPEAFKALEEEYMRLKDIVNDGQDHSKELSELSRKYIALRAFADAKAKKQRIEELDFVKYNQSKFDEGSALLEKLDSSKKYDKDWFTSAIKCEECFDAVLDAGFRALAKAERDAAFAAKRNADSVKCSVSKKDEYTKYLNAFKSGDQKFVTKNPEGAYNEYKKANEGFTGLFTLVSEARAKAQAAVDEAKNRVAQSEKVAEQADIDKPLGDEPVEGIEEDSAVLLEEDDFTKTTEETAALEEAVTEDIDSTEVQAPEKSDMTKMLEKTLDSFDEEAN